MMRRRMPAEVAVAFTVSGRREKYLRATIDSWAKVRGVRDVHLLFSVEPGGAMSGTNLAHFEAFLKRSFPSVSVHVNEYVLGCLDNTRRAMRKAFQTGAQFAICAEEDLAVSTDVLEYFTWAQRYRDDSDIQTVCAHTFRSGKHVPPGKAVRIKWFSPLVWGTWQRKWEDFILPDWQGLDTNAQAWDLNLRLQLVHADKFSLFPTQSRSIHRGVVSTLTPGMLAEYYYNASLSNCYHDHYDPQDWAEIPPAEELGMTV